MEDVKLTIALLFVTALILFIFFSVCRYVGAWTWSMNWLFSPREEKVILTRTTGHYNANGYLVPGESTSDINLCHSGSFKRFETVDHEYAYEMVDFTTETMLQQPPEQLHNYPDDVSMPCGSIQASNDLFDSSASSSASTSNTQPQRNEGTPAFVSSTPTQKTSSTASVKYPPQPLRPAPIPSFPVHEKYESEKPEKVKRPPKRPPPPVFTQVVPPPIPPRNEPCNDSASDSSGASPKVDSNVAFQQVQPPPLPPRRFPPQQAVEPEDPMAEIEALPRGVSFESLSSDTSVALADLDGPHVTGYLCVAIDFPAALPLTTANNDLVVTLLEAKDLTGLQHDGHTQMDTFVRIYLLPDKILSTQTKICRKTNCPNYNEKFSFVCQPREFQNRSLCFYVYSAEASQCVLIGEGELRLSDVWIKQTVTTWITLTDTGQFRTNWGEIMLSLNYVPATQKLTVVVAKAKNLVFRNNKETGDPFVKVYLLRRGKKVLKKKTTTKQGERNPIFNEAMIFTVPHETLQNMQLRVTVAEHTGDEKPHSIGHVIMGKQALGKTYSHWVQMQSSPKLPISMWHALARIGR